MARLVREARRDGAAGRGFEEKFGAFGHGEMGGGGDDANPAVRDGGGNGAGQFGADFRQDDRELMNLLHRVDIAVRRAVREQQHCVVG